MQALHLRAMPATVADWLSDTGSLTQRLIQHCDGAFRVKLLRQSWDKPLESERHLLRMPRAGLALVREVELCCDNEVRVFARTIIPLASLRGPVRQLALLGTRPLGEVLFRHAATRREAFEVAQLQPNQALYARASQSLAEKPALLWGRRTRFRFMHQPLLVNEIFLPNVFTQAA